MLGIGNPSNAVIDLSKNLLNLSLIANVVRSNPDAELNIIGQTDLWKQFLGTITKREGENTSDNVLRLPREKTAKNERSFPTPPSNHRIIRKLLSREVVEIQGRRLPTFQARPDTRFSLCVALFPERPSVEELVREFGDYLPVSVVSWLHLLYHNDSPQEEHSFVKSILEGKDINLLQTSRNFG